MIPISDENPTLHTPWMTWLIIGTTIAVWMLVQGAGSSDLLPQSVCNLGLVPGELTHQARVGLAVPLGDGLYCVVDRAPINKFTPLTSMFLHGGWGHLLGNMLFFWVFGNNIEDSMGPGRFLTFYLLCGLVAAGAHILVEPASPVPTVGASGAISGVMGAYLILFPKVQVKFMIWLIIFVRFFTLPSWGVIGFWVFSQVLMARSQWDGTAKKEAAMIAVFAHLGGFAFGMVVAIFVRMFGKEPKKSRD